MSEPIKIREKGAIFSHIPTFPSYLKEIRDNTLKNVENPDHVDAVRKALDATLGTVLATLNTSIPSTQWILLEYVGEYKDGEVIELTQPAMFTCQDYWDLVNS